MMYEYRCNNQACKNYGVIKNINMSISEYSEDKLPICEECTEKTIRHYSSFGLKTAGDNYKV